MRPERIENMTKGWFVGAFNPTIINTNDCEVAVKSYKKGDFESAHYHKIATEVTMVVSGRVRMAGAEWGPGDIIMLSPGEVTDFECIEDSVNVVVKHPGATDDKYLVG